jgi:hypothetical protein
MRPSWRWLAALGALATIALLASVACGDDDSDSGTGSVISAIAILDNAGLHGIDESINTNKQVPATAQSTAAKLQTVTLLTEWPSNLAAEAKALAGIFGELAAALDANPPDLAKAGDAAHRAHEGEHEFSDHVWTYLKAKAGVTGGGEDHDED